MFDSRKTKESSDLPLLLDRTWRVIKTRYFVFKYWKQFLRCTCINTCFNFSKDIMKTLQNMCSIYKILKASLVGVFQQLYIWTSGQYMIVMLLSPWHNVTSIKLGNTYVKKTTSLLPTVKQFLMFSP